MICLAALILSQAQVQSPASGSPQLTRLFPHLSGTNGYEEYLQAGDILSSRGDFPAYERAITRAVTGHVDDDDAQTPKLDFLTAVTQEVKAYPDIGALIEAGNQKRIFLPNRELNPDTPMPEMIGFKLIARFQAHSAYAQFADGRPSQGLKTLLDTMSFGHNISHGILVGSLVGIACDSITLRELDRHLNQFSLDDAQTLEQYANVEISSPPTALACIKSETSMMQKTLYDFVAKASASDIGKGAIVDRWTSMSKEDKDAVADAVFVKVQSDFAHLSDLLAGPESGWFSGSPIPVDQPLESIEQALHENMGSEDVAHSVVRAEGRRRTQFHLMQLHAKILEYRWTHGRLPISLSECASHEEIQDKVCGGQFVYRVSGQSYTLKSNGVQDTGEIFLGGPPLKQSGTSSSDVANP